MMSTTGAAIQSHKRFTDSYAVRHSSLSRCEQLLNSLHSLHPIAIDYSLERMSRLLEVMGHPERRLPPVIHVAGTNGKGSTIAIMRSLLETAGRKVHSYTSPHLRRFNERIRLAGKNKSKQVSDRQLLATLEYCIAINNGNPITFFEATTAIAFHLFSCHPADVILLEVGLGGRSDATNVLDKPAATVITSLSLDHQDYLGDTIEQIAREKAGILRADVPVILSRQCNQKAVQEIIAIATAKGARLLLSSRDFDGRLVENGFEYSDIRGTNLLPLPSLIGKHQIDNAAAAIATLSAINLLPSMSVVASALRHVRWDGRLQRLHGRLKNLLPNADIFVDGAHNPGASEVMVSALQQIHKADPRPTVIVLAMLQTKDHLGFCHPLKTLNAQILTVPLPSHCEGREQRHLANEIQTFGLNAESFDALSDAVDYIVKCYDNRSIRVVFTGSLYLVGEVLAFDDTEVES